MRRNRELFKNTVIEPLVMKMTEEDMINVLEERKEGSCSDLRRPTSFVFKNSEEFALFLDNVMDEQGLKIDCEMLE